MSWIGARGLDGPRHAPPRRMRLRCWYEVVIGTAKGKRVVLREEGLRGDDARTTSRAIGRCRELQGIGYALTEAMDEGHCGLPEDELGPLAARLLDVPDDLIRTALDLELAEGTVVADTVEETPCIFLGGLHRAERVIAGSLLGIAAGKPSWPDIDTDKALPWAERKTGLSLAPGQAYAVRVALSLKASVITGWPGVGKTTIVNSILRILSAKGVDILLCAPTGRAAKRMSEATGLEAKTIHRLLEVNPRTGGFRRDGDNPLDCSLLVVDETSMVDAMLMRALLAAVPLEGAQAALYESIRTAMDTRVREAIAARGLAASRIAILDALLKLRQVCCDPRLVRLDAARKVSESAKRARLLALLEELVAEGRKVLVFSQFVKMLKLVERDVAARGWGYAMLHGATRDRDAQVAAFQSGDLPLFLVSLKAGGTGLNLTAADTVIVYDPWWNPAVERQAMDRAHRIGQDKSVFVHWLIAENTVEAAIQRMQARKQALADALFEGTGQGPLALTEGDIHALFGPG